MTNLSLRFLLSILLVPMICFAQPSIKGVFVDKSPTIDGRLDDEAWTKAVQVGDLLQREPNIGKPVSEKTIFLFVTMPTICISGLNVLTIPTKSLPKRWLAM